MGTAPREGHKGVWRRHTRPCRGQPPYAPLSILEEHPIPTPVPPMGKQRKAVPSQWVEGMGNLKLLRSAVATGCS